MTLRPAADNGSADSGQASILVLGIVAIAVVGSVGIAKIDGAVTQSMRAQVIADAVALAGVISGPAKAQRAATLNGAILESLQINTGADNTSKTARVVVRLGQQRASAWASDSP